MMFLIEVWMEFSQSGGMHSLIRQKQWTTDLLKHSNQNDHDCVQNDIARICRTHQAATFFL